MLEIEKKKFYEGFLTVYCRGKLTPVNIYIYIYEILPFLISFKSLKHKII